MMTAVTRGPDAEAWRRRLYLPAYATAEAARYAGAPPQTIAYWHYARDARIPALPGKTRGAALSYLQLVEVAFVATFRRLGVSLVRIRRARDYLAQVFRDEFPFAQRRLLTEGKHVLLDLEQIEADDEFKRLVLADAAGQIGWRDLVGERFAEFDYEYDLALRWHVAGRQSPVLIDPRISFGAPSVHGVPTWTILGRWKAGEPVADICTDFDLDGPDVEEALRFEGKEPVRVGDPIL